MVYGIGIRQVQQNNSPTICDVVNAREYNSRKEKKTNKNFLHTHRWHTHAARPGRRGSAHTHMRGVRQGSVLRPVYTDRNLARRRAQLLVQPAVRPYPHIVLGDLHLQQNESNFARTSFDGDLPR